MNAPDENIHSMDWGSGGKTNAIMRLTMQVAKLETTVKQVSDDVRESDPDAHRERLAKMDAKLDVLDKGTAVTEKAMSELDDLKSAARWLSPKNAGILFMVLFGGSTAASTAIDRVTHDPSTVEQKIETQDQQMQRLIEQLQRMQQDE